MNLSQKRVLHWAGSLLSLVGIVFVGIRLSVFSAQLDLSQYSAITWSVMLGFTLIYGLANGLLALAWWNLLAHFGAQAGRLWAMKTYGLTQTAKYVPGNIMHLASRQAMGMARGLPGWSLARSSLWELGLIFAAGVLFFILLVPEFLPIITVRSALLGFLVAIWVIAVVLKRKFGPMIARGFGLYLVFLFLSGMLFAGMVAAISGIDSVSAELLLLYCAAFVTAWVIGLVTPGAPAGIGVREMVLLVLLRGLLPEADILLAVLVSRAVTIGGDLLFFLLCLGLARSGDQSPG